MKRIILLYGLLLMLLPGCSLREREKVIDKKMAEINEREQVLLLKENSLKLREDELVKKERLLDSTLKRQQTDTATVVNTALVGTWFVKMNCIETTCSGSAVGDTKTEQWEIGYQENTVIAKAMTGQTLVRVYTGYFSGNLLQLTSRSEEIDPQVTATMTVRLTYQVGDEMEGRREIIRTDDCRIVYSLQLKRK